MRQLQKLVILILAVGLVAWAVTDVAWAQSRGRSGGGTSGTGFQYVVKFACAFGVLPTSAAPGQTGPSTYPGGATDANGRQADVAPGFYYTDVNVHNPNDKLIKFRKKIALDGYENEHHGVVTSPVDVVLGADEALEINCNDIYRLLFGANSQITGFFSGFVVLYSIVKIDVAAIYSACPAASQASANCTGPGAGITTIQVDELISANGVPPPTVYIRGLSVSSAGVSLSVAPFSWLAYDGARLTIYDLNGQQLHDSGFTSGTELSWKSLAAGKPLANGVYFYMVEVRDVLGNVGYKVGKFALLR